MAGWQRTQDKGELVMILERCDKAETYNICGLNKKQLFTIISGLAIALHNGRDWPDDDPREHEGNHS